MNKRPYSPSRLILIISILLLPIIILTQIPHVTSLSGSSGIQGVDKKYCVLRIAYLECAALTQYAIRNTVNPHEIPKNPLSSTTEPPTLASPAPEPNNFVLAAKPVWESGEFDHKTDLAWGDIDRNGYLDLVVALQEAGIRIYGNENGTLSADPVWQSAPAHTNAILLADLNQDGWLDIAAANDGPNHVYYNNDGVFSINPSWVSADGHNASSVAVGDVTGDGRYDLIFGNNDSDDLLFVYDATAATGFPVTPTMKLENSQGTTFSLALGDFNHNDDAQIELIAAQRDALRFYASEDGRLTLKAFCPLPALDADASDARDLWWLGSMVLAQRNQGNDFYLMIERAARAYSAGRQIQSIPAETYITADLDNLFSCSDVIDPGQDDNWTFVSEISPMNALTWADVNGDGRLDLTGVNQALNIFEPLDQADISFTQQSVKFEQTGSVTNSAWVDVDGDGDLDFTVINFERPIQLFLNETPHFEPLVGPSGNRFAGYSWADIASGSLRSVESWADVDDDGDYDRIGFTDITPALPFLQLNDGQTLGERQYGFATPIHNFPIAGPILQSFAWGDVDGDERIDLAIGTFNHPTQIYRHNGTAEFPFTLYAELPERSDWAAYMAWGDVDRNGFPDLATSNVDGEIILYLNESGKLTLSDWKPDRIAFTNALRWLDVDEDADLDLIATNPERDEQRIYLNDDGALRSESWAVNANLTDATFKFNLFGDERLFRYTPEGIALDNHRPVHPTLTEVPFFAVNILQPGRLAPTSSVASVRSVDNGRLHLNFYLAGPEAWRYAIAGFYSLDDGATWRPTTSINELNDLTPNEEYTYSWNITADGLSNWNDNVRFRLQAHPYPSPEPNKYAVPAVPQRPFAQTETLPFRLRGKQIQVVQPDGRPADGAVVFYRPAAQAAQAVPANILRDAFGAPFDTSSLGVLAGRSILQNDDQLVALWPVPTETIRTKFPAFDFTDRYTLFYTSGPPTQSGLAFTPVNETGIQTLTVSPEYPLLLFHLNVSLEWDARSDNDFLADLAGSLNDTSALLYDVTNGQAALGQINLFHDKLYWNSADIQIYANNGLRPSAGIGGIVNVPVSDTIQMRDTHGAVTSKEITAYYPSQIRMGTVWDPYGERTAELGEEWSRVLAHELSHYLFFQFDNYLGIEDNGTLIPVNCPGSFMTNTTDPTYSEFLSEEQWLEKGREDCQQTLADETTGRPDWDTIKKFYPMLLTPEVQSAQLAAGPSNLPLAVTRIIPWALDGENPPLGTRNFDLRAADGTDDRVRLPSGLAYLRKTQGTPNLDDDVLIALGSPTGGGDRLKVRGADVGDVLCVFDSSGERPYTGCLDPITADTVSLKSAPLHPDYPAWAPRITARPVDEFTVTISVTQEISPGELLNVQLFPLHYGSIKGNAPHVTTTAQMDNTYVNTFDLPLPAYEIAVRIWVDDLDCPNKFKDGIDDGSNQQTYSCTRESISTFLLNPEQWRPFTQTLTSTNLLQPISFAPIGGPSNVPVGGPSNVPVGGPSNVPVGGPSNVPVGGPSNVPVGGPSNVPVGGPSNVPVGGPSRSFYAPIASADAQVVVYNSRGFFEDNGVKTLQVIAEVPSLNANQWLATVGQAYRIEHSRTFTEPRFISFNYLQRNVPAGYEESLTIYFLPDGETKWQRINETKQFVQNLVVAPVVVDKTTNRGIDGVYAVMSTIEMPELKAGDWNLLSYPVPDERDYCLALKSLEPYRGLRGVFKADGSGQRPDDSNHSLEQVAATFKFGEIYWVYIEDTNDIPVIPYFAPSQRLPDGSLPTPQINILGPGCDLMGG